MGFSPLAPISSTWLTYTLSQRNAQRILYQRLMAFIEDNLLTKESGITHHGELVDEDEELSPSLENFVILTWL